MTDKSGTELLSVLNSDTAITITKENATSLSQDDEKDAASKNGSSTDIKDDQSRSPGHSHNMDDAIIKAIETGDVEAVTDWLATLPPGDERKTELNKVKYEYFGTLLGTVLHLAANNNQTAIAKLLLDEGADPNKIDRINRNALHVACSASSDVDITEMVKLLVERKCNINERDDKHRTPLHLAARYNHTTDVRILLDEGADPNKKDSWGRNALHVACGASSDDNITEIVKLLIERNCNIDEGDAYQRTPLHRAAEYNHTAAVRMLLENGADMELKDKWGDQPIHLAKQNEVIEALVDKNADCVHWKNRCEAIATGDAEAVTDWLATLPPGDERKSEINEVKYASVDHWTVLHLAVRSNQVAIAKRFLDEGADPNKKVSRLNRNALHVACSASSHIDITEMVKLLIERNCKIDERDHSQSTPLHVAADYNHPEAVKILLTNNAHMNLRNKDGDQPVHLAARRSNNEMVKALMEHGAEVDSKALDIAFKRGYEDIVKQLIKTPKWPSLMRHTICNEDNKETTLFREMVRKMPGVAEEILNKCTLNDPDYPNPDHEDYSVAFNFEFVEDTRDEEKRNDENDTSKIERGNEEDEKHQYGCDYTSVTRSAEHNYTTSWGPVGFKKDNHPLAIMVNSKRLNLLTHPLVGSLLHHKWNRFGQYGYFINLLIYGVFLIFLTTFALIIENPRSQACLMVFMNLSNSDTQFDCGVSTARLSFIYISAIVVLILSVGRLVLEGIQFKIRFLHYFLDWINWVEIILYLCSIIFVWVFHVACLCPLTWQWQIGVVAVFMGWIDLIIFISKFPLTGIYVLMLIKILITFLKVLILSALLVFSFGLTFYLTFTQPEILRSPFSTPGRSLLKIITMTTGELDFDSIFRQDPAGGSDDAEEIPFPPISIMLWIVFIIIMPILLTNMLVGLAVGDIEAIQKNAELQKLALQVEQVLTVEEYLPCKWRRRFTCGHKKVEPNKKVSWQKRIQFIVWGGERYDTRASIGKVLHPHEGEDKKRTDKLLHEVGDLKASIYDENKKMQTKNDQVIQEIEDLKTTVNEQLLHQVEELKTTVNEKLIHQVEDVKTSINDENEKVEKLLHQVEDLRTSVSDELERVQRKNDEVLHDLKTSIDDIKKLLKQSVHSMEAK